MALKIKEFAADNRHLIIPLMLAVALSSAVFSVYSVSVISVWSVLSAFICVAIFLFCNYINANRVKGGFMLALFLIANFLLFIRFIRGGNGTDFMQWFFLAGDNVQGSNAFLLALLISFPVFFSLTVYYFSIVLYRMSFLTLISFIPCVLYIKTFEEINNVYLIIISVLNILIFIQSLYAKNNDSIKFFGAKSYIVSVFTYLFILLMFASAIPKEEDARYYDIFKSIFMSQNTAIRLGESYSQISDMSGNADNYKDFSDRIMYTVWGDEPPYLKRQVFDYYDFDNDRWYPDKALSAPQYYNSGWKEKKMNLSLTALQNAVKEADEIEPGIAQKYGLDRIAQAPAFNDSAKYLYIQANNFSAEYFLAPARCIEIICREYYGDIYVTDSGTFRQFSEQRHPLNAVYQITYYDEILSKQNWIALGGANFDSDTAKEMLREFGRVLLMNDGNYNAVLDFYRQQSDAIAYNNLCLDNNALISEEISKLADAITAGCIFDFEKAEAIQNYFHNNGFVYDLEYTAEDTSPEYFLFESKTGTCSDFASAYVLLARAAGLTARYAEGYAPQKSVGDNVYIIADSNSHAYPEVFIQNIGWVVYEPTVASQYNEFEGSKFLFNFLALKPDYKLMLTIMLIAVFFVLALVIVRLMIPVTDEMLFNYRIKRAEPKACIIMLFKRVANKKAKIFISGVESLTPNEIADKICEALKFDIHSLAFCAEKAVYGSGEVSDAEKREAMECYVKFRSALKAYTKNKR